MNSISDLNNISATPVTFNSFREYEIVFGANAGNLSEVVFANSFFLVDTQVDLLTLNLPPTPLLVKVNLSTDINIQDLLYIGDSANVQVFRSSVSSWQVVGINSIADYDSVWQNLFLGVGQDFPQTFDMAIEISDQQGNTESWIKSVSTVENTIVQSQSLVYDEDTERNLGNLQIIDQIIEPTQYTVIAQIPQAAGVLLLPDGQAVNEFSITASREQFNDTVANVLYQPAADFVGNSNILFNITRTADSFQNLVAVPLQVGNTHAEFSAPIEVDYSGSLISRLTDFAITDLRPNNIDANIQYQLNFSVDNANLQFDFNNQTQSQLQITGTKNQINTILANVATTPGLFAINSFKGNANIIYVQTQTTDNVVQVQQQIPIFYQDQLIHVFSGVEKPLGTKAGAWPSFVPESEQGEPTPNVDFWGFRFPVVAETQSGQTGALRYGNSSLNENIDPAIFDDKTNFVSAPGSIKLIGNRPLTATGNFAPHTGIVSRGLSLTPADPWYYAFWFYWDPDAADSSANTHTVIGSIAGLSAATGRKYTFYTRSLGGSPAQIRLRMTDIWPLESNFPNQIEFGAVNPQQWHHVALQKSAGTQGDFTISAWLDGQPTTQFVGNGTESTQLSGTPQTGSTWFGRGTLERIDRLGFGAGVSQTTDSPLINFGVHRGWLENPNGVAVPFNGNIDNVEVQKAAPYTDLTPFQIDTPRFNSNQVLIMSGIPEV